jgi:hypothetical protein
LPVNLRAAFSQGNVINTSTRFITQKLPFHIPLRDEDAKLLSIAADRPMYPDGYQFYCEVSTQTALLGVSDMKVGRTADKDDCAPLASQRGITAN